MVYFMPTSLEELVIALNHKDENTYLCAGATDLMIHLRNQKRDAYSLIDLTHLSAIRQIEEREDKIVIGACTTMTMLQNSCILQRNIPALAKAAGMIGSTQIRNLATIGGNVANASQCADLLPVLFAYKAKVSILDEKGAISVRLLEELVVGTGENTLGLKEAIIAFEIEKSGDYSGFSKVGSRKTVTISKINACMKAKIENGIIQEVVVYLGAVGRKPLAAPIIESALVGQEVSEIQEASIKQAASDQIEANIPSRASKHYKKTAAFGIMMDIIEEMQGGK